MDWGKSKQSTFYIHTILVKPLTAQASFGAHPGILCWDYQRK